MPQAEDFERSDYGTPSRGGVVHFGVEINMSGKGSRLKVAWVVLLNVSSGLKARVSARQEQSLRPQNLVQLTFMRPAVAKSSDGFVAISVSSASRNDGLQTLQSRPLTAKVQRLQRVVDSPGQPNTFVKPQPA